MANEIFQHVKTASKKLAALGDEQKNQILQSVADAILANKSLILNANKEDLDRMPPTNPLYDRLQLTEKRLEGIASDMRHVSTLPSPLGHSLQHKTLPNG